MHRFRLVLPTLAILVPACFGPAPHDPGLDEGDSTDASTGADPGSSGSTSSTSAHESEGGADSTTSSSTSESSSDADEGDASESSSTGGPSTCLGSDAVFDPPEPIVELNTDNEDEAPWLSSDELTLWFSSVRPEGAGGFDLYVATRAAVDAPFGEPAMLTTSTAAHDRRPSLTADGLMMYAETSDGPIGGYDIMVASRASTAADFGSLEPVTALNSADEDGSAMITGDGETILFASAGDLYLAERGPGGMFDSPIAISALNTDDAGESFPVSSSDGLTLFFTSNRVGGSGNYDIWVASRSTPDDGFGEPSNVAELNTDAFEVPTWLSDDGCRLYFFNRTAGNYDIYVARRSE